MDDDEDDAMRYPWGRPGQSPWMTKNTGDRDHDEDDLHHSGLGDEDEDMAKMFEGLSTKKTEHVGDVDFI
jgi:hypothetical protein